MPPKAARTNLLPAPQARVLRGPQEVGDGNQFSGETAGNQLPRGTLIAIRNQFWGGVFINHNSLLTVAQFRMRSKP